MPRSDPIAPGSAGGSPAKGRGYGNRTIHLAPLIDCRTTFDKLHNAAFARPADGPAMTTLLEAARQTGLYTGQPLRGWDVSCDARIFAHELPAAEVVTFGPGPLSQAHANDEHVALDDLILAAETLTRLALLLGNLSPIGG